MLTLDQILVGSIFYDSRDLNAIFQSFNVGYQALSAEGLPPQLTLNPIVVNTPHSRAFGVIFVWSSEDETTGRQWLQKAEALGTVAMSTVAMTTIPNWMNGTAKMTPTGLYGEARTHNIGQMTDEVVDIIVRSFEKMPQDPVGSSGSQAGSSLLLSAMADRITNTLVSLGNLLCHSRYAWRCSQIQHGFSFWYSRSSLLA
jgi:hypothetical protein